MSFKALFGFHFDKRFDMYHTFILIFLIYIVKCIVFLCLKSCLFEKGSIETKLIT